MHRHICSIIAIFACLEFNVADASDDKHQVCIPVIDKIKAHAQKLAAVHEDRKVAGTESVRYFCGENNKRANSETKMCYHLNPIANDVGFQVSLQKPAAAICKALAKNNPTIAGIRPDVKLDANMNFSKMRVRELKSILTELGKECRGCTEKAEYIDMIKESLHTEL